jgi:hypothetical protein
MINLYNTTDKIQLVLGATVTTNQSVGFANYRDIDTTTFTPGRSYVTTNNTTQVDLVAAPSSGHQRLIEHIILRNADTVAIQVSVIYDANGTDSVLIKVTLQVGDTLIYTDGDGWSVLNSAGNIKTLSETSASTPDANINTVVLASNVTNNNASANTIADVTGLSFPVETGEYYWFRFVIMYTSAATTTGSRWSVSGPGSPTELRYRSEYSLTTTSKTINEGASAYDIPASSNATSAATASNMAIIEGFIKPSSSGDLIARFASEVSSSAIVAKAGSIVFWSKL